MKADETQLINMIWDVKIYLAKIKDGKGKELSLTNKKSLPTKIWPRSWIYFRRQRIYSTIDSGQCSLKSYKYSLKVISAAEPFLLHRLEYKREMAPISLKKTTRNRFFPFPGI
jgi:hypothetical protein